MLRPLAAENGLIPFLLVEQGKPSPQSTWLESLLRNTGSFPEATLVHAYPNRDSQLQVGK